MAKKYENIEEIGKLITGGKIAELSKKVGAAEKDVAEILKKLSDLENAKQLKKLEEERIAAEKLAAEQAAIAKATAEAEKPVEEAKPQKQSQPQSQTQTQSYIQPVNPSRQKPAENKVFVNRTDNVRRGAGERPSYVNNDGNRPRPPQKFNGAVQPAPAANAQPNKVKNFGPDKKKQSFDRTYVDKERHTVSKRALQKQQGATVEDFDENKSGYRKLRLKKDKKQQSAQTIKIERAVVTTDDIPLKMLSEKLGISAVDITKRLFKEGIMKTVNESIDYDTAALLAAGLGIELEYKPEKTAEEVLFEQQADTVEEIESLVPRAPVVTVMGHVDHGKTSLLDYIRKANCAAGEAGGITQHIGAYTVNVHGKGITFIDTPGHEAFTAMRARGAQVTDFVILVVAADDGIMPQTIEAINHAKAANVQIIVAVNKIDRPGANPDRVLQQLTEHDVTPEQWGGETPVVNVSAKTGQGVEELLEQILVRAEFEELRANPNRNARGTIIEAKLDKGLGKIATILVQTGTLHVGDNVVAGICTGKIRAMIDDKGRKVKTAGPSMPVSVTGWDDVPEAGDRIDVVADEKFARELAEERKLKLASAQQQSTSVSLNDLFDKISKGELKSVKLIIKADVQGSVEAVKQSLAKLGNDEVTIDIIHSAVGGIKESDVLLAETAGAIIIGFNVRPDTNAKTLAAQKKIDIRFYDIIYNAIEDIEKAVKGLLEPKFREVILGSAEIRRVYKIKGVGTIAGCYVVDGKIARNAKARLIRNGTVEYTGEIASLRHEKDDVKEMARGFECGVTLTNYQDIKEGDVIEAFVMEMQNDN